MDPHIGQLVDHYAQANGVPVSLARALVMQESGGNPSAKSAVGALGVMQLMPGTAAGLGVRNPLDPEQNIAGGMKYLGHLLQEFKDPKLALAAYNAGPGAVKKYGGIPPYAETQHYVQTILANAALGTPGTNQPKPIPPPPDPRLSPGLAGSQGIDLNAILQQAGPSQMTQSILQKLGGTAGRVAERAAEPIPMPSVSQNSPQRDQQQDPYNPVPLIPHSPAHGLDGNIPMTMGGKNPYTNLHFSGHVDFQHVNPRLLDALNKEAKKLGGVVNVISGYRSNTYSDANGGFKGDPHTRGLAVDAYINGHPIGEVIPPEVWAKYGIRSGNTPGFYKGKTDPEHLDLVGVPVKGGKPKA